jgi:hypothetical protein
MPYSSSQASHANDLQIKQAIPHSNLNLVLYLKTCAPIPPTAAEPHRKQSEEFSFVETPMVVYTGYCEHGLRIGWDVSWLTGGVLLGYLT